MLVLKVVGWTDGGPYLKAVEGLRNGGRDGGEVIEAVALPPEKKAKARKALTRLAAALK